MSKPSGIDVVFVAGAPGAGKTTVSEGYQKLHPTTDQFGAGELIWGVRSGLINSMYADIVRRAADSHLHLPDDIYSRLIRERIERASDGSDAILVTGFPHDYGDWSVFRREAAENDINILGSIVLEVGRDTSIARMQRRDIESGAEPTLVLSPEEYLLYEERYRKLMGRHAIRLGCYRAALLPVVSIPAEKPATEVLTDFDQVVQDLLIGRER